MPRLMDIGLERLTKTLFDMAALSEKSVTMAIEGYSKSVRVKHNIREWSDTLLLLNEEAGDLAVELIARYQPVATDLRFIKSCMEIAYGFSRFGRYALDIAEVLESFGDISGCDHSTVINVGEKVKAMISKSIEAFASRDLRVAEELPLLDDQIDAAYSDYVRNTVKEGKVGVNCAGSATLILRYLERIADHATYIGSSIVYTMTGKHPAHK